MHRNTQHISLEAGAVTHQTSYQFKISVLGAIENMLTMNPAPAYLTDDHSAPRVTKLIDILVQAVKDPVPNVRLVAATAVGKYAKFPAHVVPPSASSIDLVAR